MNFFRRLVNPNDSTVSSKTFIGLVSFAIIAITAIANLFWGFMMAEYIFYALVGIVAAAWSLNTYLSGKKMDVENPAPVAPEVNVDSTQEVNVTSPTTPNIGTVEGQTEETPTVTFQDPNKVVG